MRTEVRFLLAIVLMIVVLVGTNLLFPPVVPEGGPDADTAAVPGDTAPGALDTGAVLEDTAAGRTDGAGRDAPGAPDRAGSDTLEDLALPGEADIAPPDGADTATPEVPRLPGEEGPGDGEAAELPESPGAEVPARITVESEFYRFTFSPTGARLVSAELPRFRSFTREGPVELLRPTEEGALALRLLVGEDTLDMSRLPFEPRPSGDVSVTEEGGPETLEFVYRHPTRPFRVQIAYTFTPGSYLVDVEGRVEGLGQAVVLTGLGSGLALNETDEDEERRSMAYVVNHRRQGIRAENLRDAAEELREEAGEGIGATGPRTRVVDGPLDWVAYKSKYFVFALLPDGREAVAGTDAAVLGGALVRPEPGDEEGVRVLAARSIARDGSFAYRVFAGPQDFARMSALGTDLEDVNPYGWRFFRPVIRPLVGVVMWVLTFFHENLDLGYGWVLILFGVLMRVLLFPLNQKAMRAQLRNMAVQPLLKDIQERYKDNPQKQQQELMKLYKEHGFNPLAGCWPMLLPWPILITLFFVFQNTIELRGVSFLWLPDLSAADPLHILPIFLGLSMFLLQWVSFRTMDEVNPQMKMMMWLMPGFMLFIFWNLASGLNLYYATANVATLPQQYWIAQERKKAKAKGPIRPKTAEKGASEE